MRFVSFAGAQGQPVAGIVQREQVADLSHPSFAAVLDGTPPSVDAFVQQGLQRWAWRLAEAGCDRDALRPLAGLKLLAPWRPGKILGAAFNFTDALAERGMAHPAEPVTFVRSGSTVLGPGEAILLPPDVGNVTYEAELAAVIGQRALRVEPGQAMRHVCGYTAHNDVSATDVVKRDGGFVRGKNMPASSPLGPWLSTTDEVPDPYRVGIKLDIDGRPLQDGSTATMLFRIAELISWLSYRMPLDPGDVIAMGTPAGVAGMHKPPAWLAPGQTVTVEVEGFGRLSNPVQRGEPFLEP
jgi:2,4-didehydro-3-deoxy-L-rhamnonate hydrolase